MSTRFSRRLLVILASLALLVVPFAPASAERAERPVRADGPIQAAQAGAEHSNEAPSVIPSLEDWDSGDGEFELTRHSRVVVDSRAQRSREDARQFAADLAEQTGNRLPVVPGPVRVRPGDIVLELDPDRSDLDDEGYELEIDDVVRITGQADAGVFYGSRTVVQAFAGGDTLPRGSTVDVPDYAERGVGVCACYVHISMEWFERLMQDMSHLKLNQLWIEAKVKSDEYPETAFWGYYTKDEIRELSEIADKYHITLVPEINSPGHQTPYLENYPELQLVDRHGERQPSRLDITQDEAFDFLTGLIDEALEVWDTPYWHMGADEYMLGSEFEDFPQILEYAQEKFGPDATPQDAFIDFVNRINAHVKSKDKTLRIWNDGLAGENTIPLDEDIIVEHWDGREQILTPSELFEQGHQVMNSSYALYLVRGGFMTDTEALYEQDWTPLSFENEELAEPHQNITGAKITMWPDNGRGHTENEVEQQAFMPMRHIAQATWGGPKPADTYAGFEELAEAIGRAPGWDDAERQPLPEGTYAMADPATGDRLAPVTAEPDARVELASDSAASWDLLPTDDGYYRLRSTGTDLCLNITEGRRYLNVPLEAGAPFTLTPCSTAAGEKTQRWQLKTSEDGGFSLVNAISQLPMARSDDDLAVQMPPDEQEPVAFHPNG
ncbi:family 20 glycosylhydrolase [Phytoactinopolyspora endophytica]|uniref:family 20 glycosylhydrolase n=1 Tax=Phytoactinopolyspora endophytica TaxID=1642495 RepID=UPI00101CFF7C|nr:family 20 glycosylhydrolase [Phytoactinopolyspora endophytica]